MILNKFARRLLSTVITSASFSLGFGNVNAITEEQKEAISSWAKMMGFDEEKVLERLTFRIRGGREFCLVPVYKFEDLKVFLRTFFIELYHLGRYPKDVRNLLYTMAGNDAEIYRHALRSLSFLIVCDSGIVGRVCIVDKNACRADRAPVVLCRNLLGTDNCQDLGVMKEAIRNIYDNSLVYINSAYNKNREFLRFQLILDGYENHVICRAIYFALTLKGVVFM